MTEEDPPNMLRPLQLIVRCEGRQMARACVRPGRYSIGHDRSNDISIDDPSVSKKHAVLEVLSELEMTLEDLESANGTYVDGQLCEQPTPLGLESLIQIGNSTLIFEKCGLPASVFLEAREDIMSPRRYDWGDALVRGGISTIHEAWEVSLNRPVAIRVMQPTSQKSARTVLRFIREAQIMAQLQHPQIPPVYELRMNEDKQLYYTTRAIEGDALSGVIDRLRAHDPQAIAQWSLPALIGVFQKAADAVAYAHSCGVMHRALRPESTVAGDFGEVLVLSWTFSRLFTEGLEPVQRQVTAAGTSIMPGLSAYTAPEIAAGTGVYDERVDVYSLGAVLYSMVSLTTPFPEMADAQLAERIVSVGVAPLHTPETPHPQLEPVIMKALSISPENRQASVRQLQAEVAACHDLEATTKKSGWASLLGRA